ncbi:hypothetical protein PsYK624_060660 [Phanerochaete sordida]|uniref:BTB domain-containing protein n=1 Tax=Phanerochaete sordida TaxID=48140 RepID=A0A9P3LDH9_9APHY|nr:hypothetical protein PsYK624_060660 [Phanerochaete sordida]
MPISTRARASENDSEPARKRLKIEDEQPQAALQPEDAPLGLAARSEQLWFERGDVIISAVGRSLKVHADVLSRHSDVFRGLLSEAALAALPESLNGCPVLRTADRGEYLEKLVGIVYDGSNSNWFARKAKPLPFAELRGVAIVASKYNVQNVIDEAVRRLSFYFPSLRARFRSNLDFNDQSSQPLRIVEKDAVAVIKLAKLLKAPFLLPTAYVVCALIDPEYQVKGVAYEDEVVKLDDDELKLCLEGHAELMEENTHVMSTLFEDPSHPSYTQCDTALKKLLHMAMKDGALAEPDPIFPVQAWFQRKYKDKPDAQPCQLCQYRLEEMMDRRQAEVWERLGGIYGVVPWPRPPERDGSP